MSSTHQFLHAMLLMTTSVIVPLLMENLNFKTIPLFSGCRKRSAENIDVFTVVVKCLRRVSDKNGYKRGERLVSRDLCVVRFISDRTIRFRDIGLHRKLAVRGC